MSLVKKIPILDADIFSRELLQPGTEATLEVIKRYGNIITKKINGNKSIRYSKVPKCYFLSILSKYIE